MHTSGIVFFSLVAAFWVLHGARVALGAAKLPWIKDFEPAKDADCRSISLLFAARDEEEKLPAALATLSQIDYPALQAIAVDDRSEDATAKILDEFSSAHPWFRVLHIAELPKGWLGKPHALQKAYEASSGEWLLFTDADVRFRKDALRRAVTLAKERNLDHLTLFGDVEMHGFWEKTLITFFGLAFQLAVSPQGVSDSKSRFYAGVGAFQLLKRRVYEQSGSHRRLAMEVVDDMKLGKIVKEAGFRSGIGIAQDAVSVRWHAGLGNLIRGVTKNFFAAAGFSVGLVAIAIAGLLLVNIAPIFGVIFGHGWVRLLAGISVVVAAGFQCGVDLVMKVPPLYAFCFPLGAMLMIYMLLRSTVVTLRQGGITWRGTFYPLEELKRGMV